jgi:hypothetical protein
MVRIIKKNAGSSSGSSAIPAPPEETLYDLERCVVGLVMMLNDIDEDIQDQIGATGEAVVDLELIPGLREFVLDILHERFRNYRDDFAQSRRTFLAAIGDRKRVKLRLAPPEPEDVDPEDENKGWQLVLYAGNRRMGTRPVSGFAAMSEFHAACWLFHRHGIRARDLWRTVEGVLPGFHKAIDSPKE